MSWTTSLLGLVVLVVDDHADSRQRAADILTAAGAKVVTASSGREAAGLLGTVWSVIVTDISMPDGTGYDLIREARLNGLEMRSMIALTALDTLAHRARILASGFACYLIKPIVPEHLIGAVGRSPKMRKFPRQQTGRRRVQCPRRNYSMECTV